MHTFGFFRQNDPIAIVFDDLTTLENTIQITHDFGTVTSDIPLYVDGVQQKNLEYNPVDGKHYCLIGVAANTTYTISTTDETGSPVTANATTNAAPVKPTPVRVRYVAPGGTGDYSEGLPGSFTGTATGEQAGDHILMEPGTYHEGDLSFSQPVIIEAKDPGNMPVISGFRQTQPSSWTDEGAGEYSTTDFDVNVKMICWVELGVNQQLAPKADRATLQADSDGWTVVGSTLYLKLPGGLDPNSETLKIPATFQNGLTFFTGASWLENLIVEGYGAGATTNNRAIRLSGSGDVALNVTIRDNHTDSIRVESGNAAIIDGCTCEMHRDYMRWVEDIKNFVGNSDWLSEGACNIVLTGATNCIVRNCQFTQCADAINIVSGCEHIDIHDNTLLNVMDESITANGTHKFVNRWNNTFDRTHYWIGYAFAENGPFFFVNEKCIDTGYLLPLDQPSTSNLQGTKYNFGGGGTVGMQVAHNCTVDCTFGSVGDFDSEYLILFASGFLSGKFRANNCILSGRDHGFWDASSGGVFDFNDNTWWNTWWLTEELGSTNRWRYGGVEYPDFATYQAGSGQDADSDFADPQLTSGVPSPVIAGKFVPGVTGNAIFGVPLANRGAQ
jgi:hypothetical protein